jgi:hypothetical protein
MKRVPQPTNGIRLFLFFVALLGLGMLIIPFLVPPHGFLIVQVADGVFRSDLEGRHAIITCDSGAQASVPVNREGTIFAAPFGRLRSGPTQFQIAVTGYQPQSFAVDVAPLKETRASVLIRPDFGRLRVSALNATKKDQQIGGNLRVVVGERPWHGPAGRVLVPELPQGEYPVTLDADGFCPGSQRALVKVGETTELKVPLSQQLGNDELARIILHWTGNPRDLDAHLLISPSPNTAHHVYFGQKRVLPNNTLLGELDVDSTQSGGYETITLKNGSQGLYQYAVHHYAGEGTISTSGAVVELVMANCKKKVYTVPPGCNKKWWHVFDIKTDGMRLDIIDQNKPVDEMKWKTGVKK